MVNRIKEIFFGVLNKLNIFIFLIVEIESQLIVYNDQNFYKVYNDNGFFNIVIRVFIYVYYFY